MYQKMYGRSGVSVTLLVEEPTYRMELVRMFHMSDPNFGEISLQALIYNKTRPFM